MKGVLILTLLIGLWMANGVWVNDLSGLLGNIGISEGLAVGTVIGSLKYNSSETVVYSTTSEYFDVLPNGTVSLKKQLVYKTLRSFQVTFVAKVPNQAEDARTFTVLVLPINHAPMFDAPSYRVSLSNANPSIGSIIYNSILVIDSDEGNNGSVIVSCDGTANANASETCDYFSVSAILEQSGTYRVHVYLARSLNPSRQSYNLSLKAVDGGGLTSSASLLMTVESLVDSRPVFSDTSIIISIDEFVPQRTVVQTVRVRDGRPVAVGNILSFDIQYDLRNWFGVGQPQISADGLYSVPILVLGNISLLNNNMDTRYTFSFYARQLVNGQVNGVYSSVPVTVNIRDVNDNTPTFNQASYAAFVPEGLTNGATIGGLSIIVYDNDLGNNSYFELSVESNPSPVPGIFGLVPTSGQGNAAVAIIVNRPEYLRFSSQVPRSYMLTLTARETRTVERRFSTATVAIQVTSTINHPPYFPNILNPIVVPDNTPVGSVISNYIRAQDDDRGPNGVLTYSLGDDPNAGYYFTIDNQTGVLTLKNRLNYSTRSSFTFKVVATDGGGLSASMSILINVMDSQRLGPQFAQPSYLANVTELKTDLFPPITITANLEPMRHDRVMRYQLSTNLSPEILSIFKVDPSTGSLTMLRGVDYMETPNKQGYFDISVEASVVGYPEIPVRSVPCRIYVLDTNNHAPYFLPVNQTYKKTIRDNIPPSTLLFPLNATDDDVGPNAAITYYIQSGGRDNFEIGPFSGLLTVSKNPRLVPDTTYNITVIAVDGGQPPLTGTTMVYITVVDSVSRPPIFQLNEYTFYVTEGSTQGLLIGAAKATSVDKRAIISYSFISTTWKAFNYSDTPLGGIDVQNWFSVSSSTADIRVQGNIVYAQARKVTVTLLAQVTNPDADVTGNLTANVPVTIYILPKGDNSDVVRFSPDRDFFYIQIYEQLPSNTEIFRFNAFYFATSTPVTDFIFYNQSVNGDYFTVEETTGILRTAKVISYSQTKPTKNITYYLLARVLNPKTVQAGATVVINILPLSGDRPVFNQSNYNFSVYSNDPPGKVIGQVYAENPPNVNGRIIYGMINNDMSIFQISDNGVISLQKRLDEMNTTLPYYTLFVTATLPNNSVSNAVVYVQVILVRSAPRFSNDKYSFNVLSNSSGPIGWVLAYDPAPFNKLPITYGLAGIVPNSNAFTIDQTTGAINMAGLTGTNPSYLLNVSASVAGSTPPLTSYAQVNVLIFNNSLDISPKFDGFSQTVFTTYYNDPNALILKVNQTTVAPGRTASLYLDTSGLPQNAKNYFYFNNNTGELRTNGAIVGTVSQNYTLYLMLSDGVSTTPKEITVGTYSQAPPTFDCKTKPILVYANDYSSPGEILTPSVGISVNTPCSYNKPDTTFFYKFLDLAQNLSQKLIMNTNTGQISANNTLNAYELENTKFKVLVAPSGSLSDIETAKNTPGSVADVTVKFIGRSIRNPTFNSSDPYCPGSGFFMQRGVLDLSPINSPVAKVQAGDCDMPGYRDVVYDILGMTFTYYTDSPEIQAGNSVPSLAAQAFRIDRDSGQVYTNVEDLRPFYSGWFSINIRASARDNANLAATSNLRLYMMRESQMLKATFNRKVSSARNDSEKFLGAVNGWLMPDYQLLPSLVTTYVDSEGARNTSASSMCYALLKLAPSGDYYVIRDLDAIKGKVNESRLKNEFGLTNLYDSCFAGSNFTTKWWSDKWFLWFILIAFSILVFFVALVLTCCVCFYWPMNLKEISKARPYVVLGDPAMSTGGSVLGDRW